MKKPDLPKILTLEETHRLRGLKHSAFQDYLCARVLFLNSKALQGCVLASQSIEKFLKMILEINGLPINNTHDISALYSFLNRRSTSEKEKLLFSKINSEYLSVLSRLFQSRYLGDCKPGFNYVILNNKFLAELDYLFSILYPFISVIIIKKPEEIENYNFEKQRVLESDDITVIPTKNGMITQQNFIYSNKTRDEFLNHTEKVIEFRITKSFKHIQVEYEIDRSFNDGKYMYKGLAFLDSAEKQMLFKKDGTLVI